MPSTANHAQSLAVLTGLLTGEQAQNAMRAAMEAPDVLLCTFPWQFTLLRALEKVGLYGLSVSVFQQYLDMLDRHLTTIPEKPGETRSDCHAWSALPLYEFPRSLLGVRPLAIGWEKLLLRPLPLLTRELSGRVPTPKGEAFVHWRLEEGAMHLTGGPAPPCPSGWSSPPAPCWRPTAATSSYRIRPAPEAQANAKEASRMEYPVTAGQLLTLDCQRTGEPGEAVAQWQGLTVFVEKALPANG